MIKSLHILLAPALLMGTDCISTWAVGCFESQGEPKA
jgi:hypothetical protein